MRTHYEAGMRALKPRFELYSRANRVNAHPWLADLVIWRAAQRAHPAAHERRARRNGNPGNLVSVRGIARLFLPMR